MSKTITVGLEFETCGCSFVKDAKKVENLVQQIKSKNDERHKLDNPNAGETAVSLQQAENQLVTDLKELTKFSAGISKYKEQLHKAKIAYVITDLGINGAFTEQANAERYLCKISNNKGETILGLEPDDIDAHGQPEFISIGQGIKEADQFLALKNLQDIRAAVLNFPQAFENLKKDNQAVAVDIPVGEYKFHFPAFAREVFKDVELYKGSIRRANNKLIDSGVGAVHVTHSVIFDYKDADSLKKVYELASDETKAYKAKNTQPIPSARTAKWHNEDRDAEQPNLKVPKEAFDTNNSYFKLINCNKALRPMSNLVEFVQDDLHVYNEVRQMILEQEKVEKNATELEILKHARQKVENTVILLDNKIKYVSSLDAKTKYSDFTPKNEKELVEYLNSLRREEDDPFKQYTSFFSQEQTDIKKDYRIFNSPEQKYIYSQNEKEELLEHRKGKLVNAVSQVLNAKDVELKLFSSSYPAKLTEIVKELKDFAQINLQSASKIQNQQKELEIVAPSNNNECEANIKKQLDEENKQLKTQDLSNNNKSSTALAQQDTNKKHLSDDLGDQRLKHRQDKDNMIQQPQGTVLKQLGGFAIKAQEVGNILTAKQLAKLEEIKNAYDIKELPACKSIIVSTGGAKIPQKQRNQNIEKI